MSEMFPTNDTWFLVHINGEPWIGRLSGVLNSTRSADGRHAVLTVVDKVAPQVTIDETWEQWQDMMSRAVKLTVPAPAATVAPVQQKPRARAGKS